MSSYLPFFAAFAVLWCLQLYGTAKQGQHFMQEVGRLRRESGGETSIGASSMSRTRRRCYVALAADGSDRVTGAIELAGLTVFARARPLPELEGRTLRELADVERIEKGADAAGRRTNAAAMAARALLDEDLVRPGEQARGRAPRTDRWRARMGGGTPSSRPMSGHAAGRAPARSSGHLPGVAGPKVHGE